jgi:transposase
MRKQHTKELKIKAVIKANQPGVFAEDVAKELGIHTVSLYRWKKELRDKGWLTEIPENMDEIKLKLDQEKELLKPRKEVKQLRLENAVLKKQKEHGDARKKKPSK